MANTLDTGGSCTLLAHRVAKAEAMTYKPAPHIKLTLANGKRMNVRGETQLTMKLNNITEKIRVIISDEMNEDMLICKEDLKTFKVIPRGFPHEIVRQVKNDNISNVLEQYKDVVNDELGSEPMKTSRQMKSIGKILTHCRDKGVTISRKKFKTGEEIQFAGHIISGKKGIRPDDAKGDQ